MNLKLRILFFLAVGAILWFGWGLSLAHAGGNKTPNQHQGQDQHQTVDVSSLSKSMSKSISESVSTSSAVNEGNNVEGDKAFGFGFGAAAMGECYRSWSVLVWQGSQLNALCMARDLMAEGKYEEAARMRCHDGGVRKAIAGKRWGKAARETCVERLVAKDHETIQQLQSDLVFLQKERTIERQKCNESVNRCMDAWKDSDAK